MPRAGYPESGGEVLTYIASLNVGFEQAHGDISPQKNMACARFSPHPEKPVRKESKAFTRPERSSSTASFHSYPSMGSERHQIPFHVARENKERAVLNKGKDSRRGWEAGGPWIHLRAAGFSNEKTPQLMFWDYYTLLIRRLEACQAFFYLSASHQSYRRIVRMMRVPGLVGLVQ